MNERERSPGPGAQQAWRHAPPPSPWQRQPPRPVGYRPRSRLPVGLRVLAALLSAVKALPLVFLLLFSAFLGAAGTQFTSPLSGDPVSAVAAIFALVLAGGALLLGQMVAAFANSKLWLAIFAGLLVAVDGLLVVDSILRFEGEDDLTGLLLILVVGACQIATFVWTVRQPRPEPGPRLRPTA